MPPPGAELVRAVSIARASGRFGPSEDPYHPDNAEIPKKNCIVASVAKTRPTSALNLWGSHPYASRQVNHLDS